MKKTILVTNDDGIYGPGLQSLVAELKKIGRVVVVVPDQERSGTSHSITLHKPLRIQEIAANTFIANGTPADCVRFGARSLIKGRIDLVVSGINSGPNLGEDVIYSGTVAGAREGTLLNIPSFAISVAEFGKGNFPLSARVARFLAERFLANGRLPEPVYFNVNVPRTVKGLRVTTLCKRVYDDEIECRTDPRGLKYYWLAGKSVTSVCQPGTDIEALEKRYASITPLQLNPSAVHLFKTLDSWIKGFGE